jgi:hypothetical protein
VLLIYDQKHERKREQVNVAYDQKHERKREQVLLIYDQKLSYVSF